MSIPKEAGKPGDGEKFQKLENIHIQYILSKALWAQELTHSVTINFY